MENWRATSASSTRTEIYFLFSQLLTPWVAKETKHLWQFQYDVDLFVSNEKLCMALIKARPF